MPVLGDYHRQIQGLINQSSFENSARDNVVRAAVEQCDTLRQLRPWDEYVEEIESEPLRYSCREVMKRLKDSSRKMEELGEEARNRPRLDLQRAITALRYIGKAWESLYELMRRRPWLGDGETGTVIKNYAMMTLRMTLAVVALVSPDYYETWKEWGDELNNNLPNFTCDTLFSETQSHNPTNLAYNTLPNTMIPVISQQGTQGREEDGEAE